MTWWRPWSWFHTPTNDHESREALAEQARKLEAAKAKAPEVRQTADRFAAEVRAAMARRQHR
jgi:hypothetical protein